MFLYWVPSTWVVVVGCTNYQHPPGVCRDAHKNTDLQILSFQFSKFAKSLKMPQYKNLSQVPSRPVEVLTCKELGNSAKCFRQMSQQSRRKTIHAVRTGFVSSTDGRTQQHKPFCFYDNTDKNRQRNRHFPGKASCTLQATPSASHGGCRAP